MYIKIDYDFYELKKQVWSGAVDTMEEIENAEKEEEFMELLKMEFQYEIPTMTAVNDFIRFDDNFIFKQLGIENKN